MCYDDGEEEWASLARDPFRWLTPRARSAGCTPELRHHMQQLGAEECGPPGGGGSRRATGGSAGELAPRAEAAIGWQVGAGVAWGFPEACGRGVQPHTCSWVQADVSPAAESRCRAAASCLQAARAPPQLPLLAHCPPLHLPRLPTQVSLLFEGDGRWYRAEVLGWDPARAAALLLYDDGEDEWVALEQEELSWHRPLGAAHSGVAPGLPRGASCRCWASRRVWQGEA